MEFESSLTRAQVRDRLAVFAKPLTNFADLAEHQFYAKWDKDNSFCLLKTGGMLSVRPAVPFIGTVEQREDRSVITGKFSLANPLKIRLASFFGFAWLIFLFACFMSPNSDISGTITVAIVVSLWAVLCYKLVCYVPNLFQKRRQAAVLEFIHTHLLS